MQEHMDASDVRKIMAGEYVPVRSKSVRRREIYQGRIQIALPLPPKVLHPNGRTKNYKWKAAETKKYREACRTSAIGTLFELAVDPPMWKMAECQCTFYLERRRDQDGLISWMKAGFDALQGIVIENDSGFIHLPPVQVTAAAAKGERKVVLVIRERKEPT